ncbi:hypothetical protein ISN44_As12g021590, partial [Arabidopsis suecica]
VLSYFGVENNDDKDNDPPDELTNYQAIAAKHEEDAPIAMSFHVNPHLCRNLNDFNHWTGAYHKIHVTWFHYEKGYRWTKRSEKDIYNQWLTNNPLGAIYTFD